VSRWDATRKSTGRRESPEVVGTVTRHVRARRFARIYRPSRNGAAGELEARDFRDARDFLFWDAASSLYCTQKSVLEDTPLLP